MALLILGVLLWSGAHLAKRLVPGFHKAMGGSERPMVAGMLFLSIILMVIGYRSADATIWWAATPMMKGINNLLILAAFYLFAASGAKSRIGVRMRHPQLIGFSLWAVGHLLVNGDMPSVVLFGGLLIWALVEMIVINRAQPRWAAPTTAIPMRKEYTTAAAAVVVFLIVGLIHGWIGPNPFGA